MKTLEQVVKEANEFCEKLKEANPFSWKEENIKDEHLRFLKHEYGQLFLELKIIKFNLEEANKRLEIVEQYVNEDEIENLSECCGAPIHEDTDICSECKEHC